MALLWLMGMVMAALSTAAGQAEQGRRFWTVRLGALLVPTLAVAVAFAVNQHEPDVPTAGYVSGLLYGVVLAGLPVLAFYALGRAARGWIATVVCVALMVPLGAYLAFTMFVIVDLVHCAPDAYECPF